MTDLDDLLRRSAADGKLSGSERQALLAWVLDNPAPQPLAVARGKAFAIARTLAPPNLDWLEDVVRVLTGPPVPPPAAAGKSEAFFSPGDACLRQIVHRFASCRASADVCVFTVTDDRIARAMLDAHHRRVGVRLITDNDKAADLGSDVDKLAAAGIPVKVDHTSFHMHHKFAVFDNARLLTGSYNWTRGAAEQNEENVIDTAEPGLVAAFRHEFGLLWAKL